MAEITKTEAWGFVSNGKDMLLFTCEACAEAGGYRYSGFNKVERIDKVAEMLRERSDAGDGMAKALLKSLVVVIKDDEDTVPSFSDGWGFVSRDNRLSFFTCQAEDGCFRPSTVKEVTGEAKIQDLLTSRNIAGDRMAGRIISALVSQVSDDLNNESRAEWAESALDTFTHETFAGRAASQLEGEDHECAISDLFCNLYHYAVRNGYSVEQVDALVERAKRTFEDEVDDECLDAARVVDEAAQLVAICEHAANSGVVGDDYAELHEVVMSYKNDHHDFVAGICAHAEGCGMDSANVDQLASVIYSLEDQKGE